SYAYHGVHPFYMWYWGSHALKHLGRVIVVGGDDRAVKRLGFKSASTLNDAFEMAEDVVGPQPTITHYKNPPLVMADVTCARPTARASRSWCSPPSGPAPACPGHETW